MDADPRSQVEAPVRGALVGVMGRGLALVGHVSLLALWPIVARPEAAVRDAIAGIVFGCPRRVRGLDPHLAAPPRARPPEEARELAWDRAREIDGDDAALGLLVAGWVPGGLLARHRASCSGRTSRTRTRPSPPHGSCWGCRRSWLAWLFVTTTWLDACRDDLARAEQEADTRLRTLLGERRPLSRRGRSGGSLAAAARRR